MKVALCLSGELRRVDLFFPIIKKNILEPYNPDIFISTWKMTADVPTSRVNTNRDPKEISSIEYVCDLYKPKSLHFQEYTTEIKERLKKVGNTSQDNLLCMTFHIYFVNLLSCYRSFLNDKYYDVVIRHRFDYGIKSSIKFEEYDLTKINIPNEHAYGGYQDQFAFGNTQAMNIYANWFVKLPDIENAYAASSGLPPKYDWTEHPWNPESALQRYLDISNVSVNLIDDLKIVYPWCTKEEIEEEYISG